MNEGEAAVQSPCVRNCCLDENEVCLGCGRALNEITGWNEASDAQRRAILARAARRRDAREARLRALQQEDA